MTQTIVTTEVDTHKITMEQVQEAREMISRAMQTIEGKEIDADVVIASLAAISRLHKRLIRK